jgi:hypothetical protein
VESASTPGSGLEKRIADIGSRLAGCFGAVLDGVPGSPAGPADLARALGIDKVLASRILKAARNKDPIAVVHLIPGPEPLRRLLRAAGKARVPRESISDAQAAVEQFDSFIRREAGDRSALDAIISAWLPEARQEFELRRKQSAFRAMSLLKGAAADIQLDTVLLHPSDDGKHLDIVWLFGIYGLQRLRPGSAVKSASRRFANEESPRQPRTLDGEPVEGLEGLLLSEFCSAPNVGLDVHRVGEVVHYTLADNGFGPGSAVDLVSAEVNYAEMMRYVPAGSGRKGYVFAEVTTPVKSLIFDVLVHPEVYPNSEPGLIIYDTSFDGIVDANDPSRDVDRFDLSESIQPLGRGIGRFRTAEVPRYAELLRHVCGRLDWEGDAFRGYRVRIEYPVYGSQVTVTFDAPPAPGG